MNYTRFLLVRFEKMVCFRSILLLKVFVLRFLIALYGVFFDHLTFFLFSKRFFLSRIKFLITTSFASFHDTNIRDLLCNTNDHGLTACI